MENIIFSKTSQNEIDIIVTVENDIENSNFINPESKENHLKNLANKDYKYITVKNHQEKIVGFVILAGISTKLKRMELKRIIITEKRKGYGKASIQKVKKLCFSTLNFKTLWLDVFEFNKTALRLYQSEGFKVKRKLKNYIYKNDNYQTLIIMQITNKN